MTEHRLQEVPEARAPAHIAAIYGEIRRLGAVPMVALIFRHLASHPRGLELAWESLRPLFESGRLQEAAWAAASAAHGDLVLPRIEANARAVIGLEGEALDTARRTLDAYNRANPVNLLAMSCLLGRLTAPEGPWRPQPATAWTPPPPLPGPMPPMVAPEDMPRAVRLLVNDLGPGDRSRLDPVVPSLYRHFAGNPGFLAIVHVLLVPRFRDGSVARAVSAVSARMQAEADGLVPAVAASPGLEAMPAVRTVLEQFTSGTIPQMIAIGHALRAAIG